MHTGAAAVLERYSLVPHLRIDPNKPSMPLPLHSVDKCAKECDDNGKATVRHLFLAKIGPFCTANAHPSCDSDGVSLNCRFCHALPLLATLTITIQYSCVCKRVIYCLRCSQTVTAE